MERKLEVYQLPDLFSSAVQIVITFSGAHFGSAQADGEDAVTPARDRLLCHLVHQVTAELIKAATVAWPYEHLEACKQLEAVLGDLRTGSHLEVAQQFIRNNLELIRRTVPPAGHRMHRASLLKSEFLQAIAEFSPTGVPAGNQ